ncbi:sensor histidine kinase [Dyadobacter diqingensis]|uniref:sensor histidine kinase n=1 Tax=Dyadobacter diqingensis TaxID=2938121 RepID=UPI0020C19B41|nr:sensor histidine kinase [Dyadobacter diqingensis]
MNIFNNRTLLFHIVFFLCFLSHGYLTAQKHYTVSHYTGDNGLPQNSIKSIAADSEGFVWMISEDGLIRFDGQRFSVFNKSNLKISNNRFFVMMPSLVNPKAADAGKTKVIYTAVPDDEFIRIEKGKAVLDTLYYKSQLKPKFPANSGLDKTVLAAGIPHYLSTQFVPENYLIPTGCGDNNYYLCDSSRIRYFEKGKISSEVNTAGRSVWNLFTLDRRLYHFNGDGTITLISKWGDVAQPLAGDITENPADKTQKSNCKIYWNISSAQAFIYLDKNIYQLSQQNGKLVTQLIMQGFDLKSANIQSVFFDEKNQRLFLGSITQGLYVLTRQRFQTLLTKGDDMENVFYGQLDYENNTVLTPNGIMIRKEAASDSVISAKITAMHLTNAEDKRSMLSDDQGFIWIKEGQSLLRLNRKDLSVNRVWKLGSEIKVIYKDDTGYIWIGMTKSGLYGIDPSDFDARLKRFLRNLKVNYLASASPGNLLIGTESGLYNLQVSSGKCSLLPGTEGLFIKSIYAAGPKELWFTAQEKGVMFIGSDHKVVNFPLDKNRFLASPHCIVDDGKGYLWVPTNKGLFQIAKRDLLHYAQLKSAGESKGTANKSLPTELFYLYHSREEGFNTNEFNGSCQPCGLKLQNGFISLPSLSGLVWFKPDEVRGSGPEASIILDRVEVNNKVLTFSGDTLHFPLDPQYIKLRFSSAYFGHKYNLNLSYALVKKNVAVRPGDWIAVDNDNPDISFSSLNSGEYTLLVRKLNGFGISNYTIKKIYFVVPLLWYQTWWATVLFVLVMIAGVYLFYVIKVKNMKRENARLEALVGGRTERLNNALLDLETSKKDMSRQIQMLSMLLTSMTHDVQSPLNFIALTSGGIPKMIDEGNLKDVSHLGTLISDSSKRMSMMLRDLLDYVKIQVYGNRMKFEEINLKALIDNKLAIFKNVILHHESGYVNEVPEDLSVYSDYQMLSILVHNLIDNAAKFTQNGSIQISAKRNKTQRIELVIANSTIGLPDEFLEMINNNEEISSTDVSVKYRKKVGMGLLIVKEVAALVGVTLKVTQTDMIRFHLFFE